LILYTAHHPDTNFSFRILAINFVCLGVTIVVYMNVMSTWIYTAARKPYLLLLRYVSTRRPVLSHNDRLKVMAFIERLSTGPAIGYYCYNLFAMNGHEFAQFLLISGAN